MATANILYEFIVVLHIKVAKAIYYAILIGQVFKLSLHFVKFQSI